MLPFDVDSGQHLHEVRNTPTPSPQQPPTSAQYAPMHQLNTELKATRPLPALTTATNTEHIHRKTCGIIYFNTHLAFLRSLHRRGQTSVHHQNLWFRRFLVPHLGGNPFATQASLHSTATIQHQLLQVCPDFVRSPRGT